jgi:hypothetical protein
VRLVSGRRASHAPQLCACVFGKLDWLPGQVERVCGRAISLHQWERNFWLFPRSMDADGENVSRMGQFWLHRVGSRGSSGP